MDNNYNIIYIINIMEHFNGKVLVLLKLGLMYFEQMMKLNKALWNILSLIKHIII